MANDGIWTRELWNHNPLPYHLVTSARYYIDYLGFGSGTLFSFLLNNDMGVYIGFTLISWWVWVRNGFIVYHYKKNHLQSKAVQDLNQCLYSYQKYALTFWANSLLFTMKIHIKLIQAHLPVRLPCYDFTLITKSTLKLTLLKFFQKTQLSWCDGRCVQGPGTYSPP